MYQRDVQDQSLDGDTQGGGTRNYSSAGEIPVSWATAARVFAVNKQVGSQGNDRNNVI